MAVWFIVAALCGASGIAQDTDAVVPPAQPASVMVSFTERVGNIEYGASDLSPFPPRFVSKVPAGGDGLWYGRIKRAVPVGPSSPQNHLTFVCRYAVGSPVRAWFDTNQNGDLTDDGEQVLYAYPDPRGARAFLVDMAWPLGNFERSRKIRVVLEPQLPDSIPVFRWQNVYAPIGVAALDGKTYKAFLFDGNHDGVYSQDYADGMFLDLEGDGLVTTDPMSPEFFPFSVPSQVGGTRYKTREVDSAGAFVVLHVMDTRAPERRAAIGQLAPNFETVAIDGRPMRLNDLRGHVVGIYFWAAWCGVCNDLAVDLRRIYDRYHEQGFEILSISMDDDLNQLREFQARHKEPWPVSYSGRRFWENPLARVFGAWATGSMYLVNRDGHLEGVYHNFDEIEMKLSELFGEGGKAAH